MQNGSEARGRVAGATTKMQNNNNTTFLALLRHPFALEWTKKLFKACFETYIQKQNSKISDNFEEWPKISYQI